MQRDTGGLERLQQFPQPRRHFERGPVACPIPFALQGMAVLQGQTPAALGDEFQIAFETLPQAALTALPFLVLRGHANQGQRVGIARDETVQCREHGQRIGAVGLDPLVLVIPVARTDDVIGCAQRGELPVKDIAEGAGLVAGDDAPALGDLFLHPRQQALGREALGRLGKLPVILHGHDVLVQMHIQGQLECAGLMDVIYRLRRRNRRCRTGFVMHTGREFIRALPRSLSAHMFSNY